MGFKARHLLDGLQIRNQWITGRAHRIQEYSSLMVSMLLLLELKKYPLWHTPTTNDSATSCLPTLVLKLTWFARFPPNVPSRCKKVRPLNLTSQNQLLKNIQNVDLTAPSLGEYYQITGMKEPTSVYDDNGYPDPYSNPTTNPTIISL